MGKVDIDISKLFSDIVSIFKMSNIVLFCFICSGILLFAPRDFLQKLYLLDFRDTNGFILGLIFLSSSVISFIYFFVDNITSKYTNYRFKRNIKEFLYKITNETEIAIISKFMISKDNTLYLKVNSGAVRRLCSVGIIQQLSSENVVNNILDPQIAYFMQQLVYNIIKDDENLVKKFSEKDICIDTDNTY